MRLLSHTNHKFACFSAMEDTPKTPWDKKRLLARMDQVRAAKRNKISSEPSSSSPAGSSATVQSPGTDSSSSGAAVT